MTERCEICGRGYLQGAVVPNWFPHEHVCARAKCHSIVQDALLAIVDSREQHADLIRAIKKRHNANGAPVGCRQDTLAQMYVEHDDWWGLDVISDRQ